MTKEEIENGNQLIATFHGRYTTDQNKEWVETDKTLVGEYEYHCSWDWLMSVIEKIESNDDFSVEIIDCVCDIKKFSTIAERHQTFIKKLGNNKIEATWICVVELMKWMKNEDARMTNLTERGE